MRDRGGSSPQRPRPPDAAFVHPVRGMSWSQVERILRAYVALDSRPGISTYGERGEGFQRGAHASELWRATVASRLERDPHRHPAAAWKRDLDRLLHGRRGLFDRLSPTEFGRLLGAMFPLGPRISVPTVWAHIDAMVAWMLNSHAEVDRLRRISGQVKDLEVELRSIKDAWLDAEEFVRRHPAYAHSLEWLGRAYRKCADADRSFMRHLGED